MTDFPKRWLTIEETPRKLIAEGVAQMDPDCLVARVEGGDGKPLWIIYQGSGFVCGLGVRATPLAEH